ncbi:MAG: hypothetical protein J6W41_00470 [Alphaproteobacteria bacterium]|nr:hypothetical protein [Alphaproteobacteria bacterium]
MSVINLSFVENIAPTDFIQISPKIQDFYKVVFAKNYPTQQGKAGFYHKKHHKPAEIRHFLQILPAK